MGHDENIQYRYLNVLRRHDIVRETIYKITAIRKIDPYRLIAIVQ